VRSQTEFGNEGVGNEGVGDQGVGNQRAGNERVGNEVVALMAQPSAIELLPFPFLLFTENSPSPVVFRMK
jgi:hypothetical protein